VEGESMTGQSGLVLVERRGPISVVTFNEPARMNPFSDTMRAAALEAVEGEMESSDVRALVITGAGGNFSAGADVRQMGADQSPGPARSRRVLGPLHGLVRAIIVGPKPVVAAIEGAAYGAGLALAAAADFAISGSGARYGAAFGKIGLTADTGLLWSLPQRIGLVRTKDMIFTGRPILADEAVLIGLIDRVVPAGAALDAAVEKAMEYMSVGPLVIGAVKSALSEGPMNLEAVLRLEGHQHPLLTMTKDHEEGRRAFIEKRTPDFTGL
jgi:enoyl-CoA hydratase/carnithine racemase